MTEAKENLMRCYFLKEKIDAMSICKKKGDDGLFLEKGAFKPLMFCPKFKQAFESVFGLNGLLMSTNNIKIAQY